MRGNTNRRCRSPQLATHLKTRLERVERQHNGPVEHARKATRHKGTHDASRGLRQGSAERIGQRQGTRAPQQETSRVDVGTDLALGRKLDLEQLVGAKVER